MVEELGADLAPVVDTVSLEPGFSLEMKVDHQIRRLATESEHTSVFALIVNCDRDGS
jgi:hypothetical protein